MTDVLHVLVVDDHATVREGLIRILAAADARWQAHGAPDAQAALELVARQRFDIGIVDMSMPGMNGIELVRTLRAGGHRMPLLMLSMHAEEAYALRAFQAGANGYIAKDRASQELPSAVRRVAAGGSHVPPALVDRVMPQDNGAVTVPPHARLSGRELDILRQLARGLDEAEVARRLGLTPRTVTDSRARLQDKLGLSSAQALADYALAHQLIPLP